MIKKTITYTDYNGEEITETFRFNLNKAELARMDMSEEGGMSQRLRRIVESRDGKGIVETIRSLIRLSYGEISPDGRRFVKSEAMADAFEQTEAYAELFMELCFNAEKAAEFARGIMPQNLQDAIAKVNPDL